MATNSGYGASQPYQQPPPPSSAEDPGKTLGIVGLVLSFFTTLIGMIISIVALRQSRKAGFSNTPAVIGIVVGAIGTLVATVLIIVAVVALGAVAAKCSQLGPGVHQEGGVTYTCS
jgi:hypothetical protein